MNFNRSNRIPQQFQSPADNISDDDYVSADAENISVKKPYELKGKLNALRVNDSAHLRKVRVKKTPEKYNIQKVVNTQRIANSAKKATNLDNSIGAISRDDDYSKVKSFSTHDF